MLFALLDLDRSIRKNWFLALSTGARVGLFAGILGSIGGFILLGESIIRPSALADLENRIDQWSFWCATTIALVFGYTSFEVLYRDHSALRIAQLPTDRNSLFWLQVIRVYRAHLPLLVIPVATGLPLLWSTQSTAYLLTVANCCGVLVWGLALSIWVHLLAGESLLHGESLFKGLLAGNVAPSETAFLFYSPAGALTSALCISLFSDMGLTTGATQGIWGPYYTLAAIFTLASVIGLLKARRIYIDLQHQIAPRFADAEVVPPWREGELPRQYLGERLGRLLPLAARPLWHRNIVMYRRRFRVMVPLMVLVCGVLAIYVLKTAGTPGGPLRVTLVSIALGGLILTPVFRVLGLELGTRFDARALPIDRANESKVQWLLAAMEWGPLILSLAIASLMAGFSWLTFGIVGATILGFVGMNAVAIPASLKSSPHVRLASVTTKGGLLMALGFISLIARSMGL